MQFLRRMHTSLVFEIEFFLEELITRFKPSPEEELLCAIYALQHKCLTIKATSNKLVNEEPVPSNIISTIQRIHKRFFPKIDSSGKTLMPLPSDSNFSKQHTFFQELYGKGFIKDFSPLALPKLSIEILLRRLVKWKHFLKQRLDMKLVVNSETLRLEDSSRRLTAFSSELPGCSTYGPCCCPMAPVGALWRTGFLWVSMGSNGFLFACLLTCLLGLAALLYLLCWLCWLALLGLACFDCLPWIALGTLFRVHAPL